jgi:hypothetical protein
VSTEEVYAMWHPRGYGGYKAGEAVTVKGLSHALVTDWIGDNQGECVGCVVSGTLSIRVGG